MTSASGYVRLDSWQREIGPLATRNWTPGNGDWTPRSVRLDLQHCELGSGGFGAGLRGPARGPSALSIGLVTACDPAPLLSRPALRNVALAAHPRNRRVPPAGHAGG